MWVLPLRITSSLVLRRNAHSINQHRFNFNNRIFSRLLNTSRDETVQSRDIFVFDPSYPLSNWDKLGLKGFPYGLLKHPKSGHIVADYAIYYYLNSDYNFNVKNEYSINISPVHSLYSENSNIESNSLQSESHSIYIWPESLVISNVLKSDVADICKLYLTNFKINIKNLKETKKSHWIIQPVSDITCICAISSTASMSMAKKTLDWFHTSANKLKKMKSKSISYLLSCDMRGHRSSANILIFPSEDEFDNIATYDKAEEILSHNLNQ